MKSLVGPMVLLVGISSCVACEDDPGESCPAEVAQSTAMLTIAGAETVLPKETTEATLTLTFDVPVNDVTAEHITLTGEGATLGSISGEGAVYTVQITGVSTNGSYELLVSGVTTTEACSPIVPDASVQLDVEGWRHIGPIQTGAAKPTAAPYFNEVTEEVQGFDDLNKGHGRATIVDVDGDGLDDIATLGLDIDPMNMRLYRNLGASETGTPRFEDITAAAGLDGLQAAIIVFGDVDNDGDPDLFTGVSFRSARTGTEGAVGIWLNDGSGVFTYQGESGIASGFLADQGGVRIYKEMAAATFADFNNDGMLDLYIGMWNSGSTDGSYLPAPDELYQGDGTGRFTEVTLPDQHNPLTSQENPQYPTTTPRAAYGVATGDYDNDGDVDIFVNNYGAGRPAGGSPPRYWDHNLLWRNDGNMTFVNVAEQAQVHATLRGIGGVQEETPVVMSGRTYPSPIGGNGFGCQWGDFDNDGDLDLVVGTIAHPDYTQSDRLMLHTNPGGTDPVFGEESAERGLEYYEDELHPAFVDLNHDGYQDLAVSRLRGGSKWEFYFQNANNVFTRQSQANTGVDVSRPGPSLWFDADGDGDLDFYMPKNTENTGGRLFLNSVGQLNNVLILRLVGSTPRDATGARVTLTSSAGTQTREITSGVGHYNTQSTDALYFGLSGDSGAGNVTVRWPNGDTQTLGDVRANLELRVTQDGEIEIVREL